MAIPVNQTRTGFFGPFGFWPFPFINMLKSKGKPKPEPEPRPTIKDHKLVMTDRFPGIPNYISDYEIEVRVPSIPFIMEMAYDCTMKLYIYNIQGILLSTPTYQFPKGHQINLVSFVMGRGNSAILEQVEPR